MAEAGKTIFPGYKEMWENTNDYLEIKEFQAGSMYELDGGQLYAGKRIDALYGALTIWMHPDLVKKIGNLSEEDLPNNF